MTDSGCGWARGGWGGCPLTWAGPLTEPRVPCRQRFPHTAPQEAALLPPEPPSVALFTVRVALGDAGRWVSRGRPGQDAAAPAAGRQATEPAIREGRAGRGSALQVSAGSRRLSTSDSKSRRAQAVSMETCRTVLKVTGEKTRCLGRDSGEVTGAPNREKGGGREAATKRGTPSSQRGARVPALPGQPPESSPACGRDGGLQGPRETSQIHKVGWAGGTGARAGDVHECAVALGLHLPAPPSPAMRSTQ